MCFNVLEPFLKDAFVCLQESACLPAQTLIFFIVSTN